MKASKPFLPITVTRPERTKFRCVPALLLLAALVQSADLTAQTITSTNLDQAPQTLPLSSATIIERGPSHQVWQAVANATNSQGLLVSQVNRFTELASGLNHMVSASGTNYWAASSETIDITDTGAQATNAQNQAFWAPNANTAGLTDLLLADGTNHLRANPLCLAYADSAPGSNVIIATIKDSIGEAGANSVTYPDAFLGTGPTIDASLRYVFKKAGFSQSIIIHSQIPSPALWGLSPSTSKLQIISEFLNPPTPQIESRLAPDGSVDHKFIGFGNSRIGPGLAFLIGTDATNLPAARVQKQWYQQPDGRQFLIEQIPYETIAAQLSSLPPPAGSGTNHASISRQLGSPFALKAPPQRDLASRSKNHMKVAKARSEQKGFAIDYEVLSYDQDTLVLQADKTYLVTADINVNTLIIEPAVVKFLPMSTDGASWGIFSFNGNYTPVYGPVVTVAGQVTCKTAPYRRAIFTAKDDDNYGQVISYDPNTPSSWWSTGSPSGQYAAMALHLYQGNSLQYLRFLYAAQAVVSDVAGEVDVSHCEFLHCLQPLCVAASGTALNGYNLLAQDFDTFLGWEDFMSFSSELEHLTLHQGNYLTDPNAGSYATVNVVNSLLVTLANSPAYGINIDTTTKVLSDDSFFVTVAAGSHYLPANSPYRHAGTTSISQNLLANLATKTTQPPDMLSGPVEFDTVLSPSPNVTRDRLAPPDLGYHYDPVDYIGFYSWLGGLQGGLIVNNGVTLTLTNGVVLGVYGSWGVQLGSGSKLISGGSATTLNRIVSSQGAQEQNSGWSDPIISFSSGSTVQGTFTFTELDFPPGGNGTLLSDNALGTFQMSHCQLRGGTISVSGQVSGFVPQVELTNNLFFRSAVTVADYYQSGQSWNSLAANLFNNLFYAGSLTVNHSFNATGSQTWTVRDNFLYQTAASGSGSGTVQYDYNAYLTGYSLLTASQQTHDKVIPDPGFLTGPLGEFYQPTTSQLINVGSRTAANATLYQFTLRSDLAYEDSTQVDIGFHYVTTDSYGNPLDYDGDGLWDYVEDSNGNGSYDQSAGETNWQSYNSPNGLVAGSGLQVFTPLK